jgi:hypothetical protein
MHPNGVQFYREIRECWAGHRCQECPITAFPVDF